MGATVNIDTGGTFTDGYLTRDGQSTRVKVDTTPHDLTECLAMCLAEGASSLGYPNAQALLLDTDVMRFSSTIGTNSIIQRTGPRVGLLISEDAAETLYGDGESPLYEFFVLRDLVAEVKDPFDVDEVRRHVRRLLVAGARILVVSLQGSEEDPRGEEAIRAVVQDDYPRHYLGAVPCLIASEVTPRPGAAARTATAVINAYLHPDMVKTLYKADEDLRSEGFPHPLLIAHASGGLARVAKTKAIETYNSGPAGGVYGAARFAALYGLQNVVTLDIGGTSTDVALVMAGLVPFDGNPSIGGIAVNTPMVGVGAIGGGGGSIARKKDGEYTVGPDSVGASPGPACYGLGGTQPTACDAELVLGHVDPDWFLGGRRKLDGERARNALAAIAADDTVEEAAAAVRDALVARTVAEVGSAIEQIGTPPSEFTLLAFGGGGGLYAAEVAAAVGVPTVLCPANSSVFSAFGISGMDVGHVYELSLEGDLPSRLAALRERARLDAGGEGLDPDTLTFQLEIEVAAGLLEVVPLQADADFLGLQVSVPDDSRAIRFRASSPVVDVPPVPRATGDEDPSQAKKSQRDIYRSGGYVAAGVFDRDLLEPGNVVHGPALIDAVDTTIVVPAHTRFTIDGYGTGIIEGSA